MVLDEASPTADTFTNPDVPQDDLDPYSSSSSSSASSTNTRRSLPPTIDLTKLPRPIPIFAPLFGYSDSNLRKLVEYDAATMSAILQRPLTLPEWEATAFHMAKMHSYTSYGWPLGFAWGAYRARKSMHEWRFPGYKPDLEKIGRDRFDRFLTLRGEAARMAWQTLRFGVYMGTFGTLSKLIVTMYGVNVGIAGQRVDDRLSEFWEKLRSMDREEIRRRRQSVTTIMGNTGPEDSDADGESLGSFEGEDGGEAAVVEQSRTQGMQRGQQLQQSQQTVPPGEQGVWARRRAAAARGELPTPMSAQSQASESPQASGGDFDFDDASPMAREPPQQEARGGKQQESSWDRLRRGNGSQPSGLPNQQPNRPLQGAQGDAWARVRGSSGGSSGGGGEPSL